ncbi:MAG: DUF551 domain-containing protein [Sulfurimonas sp.]|jgi:siderophore synthetase component
MKWISVKKRLPKYDDDYLVYTPENSITPINVMWFDVEENHFTDSYYKEVTHWQPLPKPPKVK